MTASTPKKKVFIIHGHESDDLKDLIEVLKELEVEPITLSRRPKKSRAIIERFEQEAEGIEYECVFFLCKNGTSLPSDLNAIDPNKYTGSVREPRILDALEIEMTEHGVIGRA